MKKKTVMVFTYVPVDYKCFGSHSGEINFFSKKSTKLSFSLSEKLAPCTQQLLNFLEKLDSY